MLKLFQFTLTSRHTPHLPEETPGCMCHWLRTKQIFISITIIHWVIIEKNNMSHSLCNQPYWMKCV